MGAIPITPPVKRKTPENRVLCDRSIKSLSGQKREEWFAKRDREASLILNPTKRIYRRIILVLSACAIIVLFAAVLFGAEPKAVILGPSRSLPGDLVVLKTDGTVGSGHAWSVDGPEGVDARWFAVDGGKNVVFAARKAGRYVFFLAVAELVDGKPAVAMAKHVLHNAEEGPDPNPQPDPDPQPTPGKRLVLVIRESRTQTVQQAKVIEALRVYATAKRHAWRVHDPDQAGPWLEGYKTAVVRAGLAAPVLVVDSDSSAGGGREWVDPLPATAEAAVALVQKHGG